MVNFMIKHQSINVLFCSITMSQGLDASSDLYYLFGGTSQNKMKAAHYQKH